MGPLGILTERVTGLVLVTVRRGTKGNLNGVAAVVSNEVVEVVANEVEESVEAIAVNNVDGRAIEARVADTPDNLLLIDGYNGRSVCNRAGRYLCNKVLSTLTALRNALTSSSINVLSVLG
ncbi:hypothetical protein HA402_015329 [Bradysia odoriphaga]|nr:hypothetical protein HA402_015329 [Bradysia odoriphaga]